MNRFRNGLLTIAAALLTIAVGAAPAQASAATTSTSWCSFEFVSLTATNLWHDGGKDWIWFVMDGWYFPGNTKSIQFFQGTTQTAGTFGNPRLVMPDTDTATFQVVLDRTWPTANLVIDSNQLTCANGTNLSLRFSDGDATYDLKYNAVW